MSKTQKSDHGRPSCYTKYTLPLWNYVLCSSARLSPDDDDCSECPWRHHLKLDHLVRTE